MKQARGLRKKPGINKEGMGKGQRLRVAAGRTWLLGTRDPILGMTCVVQESEWAHGEAGESLT